MDTIGSMNAPDDSPVWFGIGCYSFEAPGEDLLLMQNRKGSYNVYRWAEDVEAALRMIPSLDNITLEGFRYVRGDHRPTWRDGFALMIRDDSADGGQHQGGDLRPHPSSGRIRFTVTIPQHVQRSVLALAESYKGTEFEVDIWYGDGMPVSFVRSVERTDDPAISVAIVREFLRSEFEQRVNANSPIRFVFMGPSPMWTQCAVGPPKEGAERPLEVTRHDAVRYEFAAFTLQKTAEIMTTADAYEAVKSTLEEPMGRYYDLVSQTTLLRSHQRFIEFALEDLVELHRSRGFRAWSKRLLRGGTDVNDLMLEVLAADVERQSVEAFAADRWAGSEVAERAFGDLWEREGSNRDYTDHVKSVAEMLGARQSRSIELVTVLAASLLGGVAGASLTALVQGAAG